MRFVTSKHSFSSQLVSTRHGGVKKSATPALLVSLLAITSMAASCMATAAPQVLAKLAIELPADGHLTYQGQAASQFPDGLPIGLGSGLSIVG